MHLHPFHANVSMFSSILLQILQNDALREKCPNTGSLFSQIPTEYEVLWSNSPYSDRIRENTDQKKLCQEWCKMSWGPNLWLRGESLICNNSFNRDLNRDCLVYMCSLRFSLSILLINLRRQFCIRKNFFVYVKFFVHKFLRDRSLFILYLKLLFRKCLTYALGSPFIETRSLTGC